MAFFNATLRLHAANPLEVRGGAAHLHAMMRTAGGADVAVALANLAPGGIGRVRSAGLWQMRAVHSHVRDECGISVQCWAGRCFTGAQQSCMAFSAPWTLF